jgi:ketosteroid isomerase-like protein
MSRHADEATVRRWFDAFNSRDLEGMLACMHPHVDFHPLCLPGLSDSYEGHRGVSEWFTGLEEMGHSHRIELAQTSVVGSNRVIAAGTLTAADPAAPASFWALTRFEAGQIISSRHHLSDRFHLR